MKKIGQIIKNKNPRRKTVLDGKTVFYIFTKVIQEEFGKRGVANLRPDFYKNGKIFVKTESSNWASELWLNRVKIIREINKELGMEEVKEIKMK